METPLTKAHDPMRTRRTLRLRGLVQCFQTDSYVLNFLDNQ